MKIFLDTNILLDLLLKRKNVQEAMMILGSVERGINEAIILDISLVNIAYISKKQEANVFEFLELLVKHCKIIGANNTSSLEAIKLKNNDFEDSLQYVCAKDEGCEVIVTNDKKFYRGSVDVCSSVEFVQRFLDV